MSSYQKSNNELLPARWLVLFILFTCILTSIPYVMGYWVQKDAWAYTGFVIGVEDGNSYIAKMLRGSVGDWLFRSPFSAIPQDGFIAFLPYMLLGKLAKPPGMHEQLVALFHLFRWLGIMAFVLGTYKFASVFLPSCRQRKLATILAAFGGGLGWLSVLGVRDVWHHGLPLEFYSPETFGFLSIFGLPHLTFARGLLFWGFSHYLSSPRRGRWLTGLIWLLMGFFQPLAVVTAWFYLIAFELICTASRMWNRDHIRENTARDGLMVNAPLVVILISSPVVIYNLIAFQVDPFLMGWAGQNLILSPPLLDYLLGYVMILPLSLYASWLSLRKGVNRNLFLISMLVLFPAMVYLPYPLQRRIPDGVWVGIIILAIWYIGQIKKGLRHTVIKLLIVQSFFTSFVILIGALFAVMNPSAPLFLPGEEVKAFNFIATLGKDHVVLSSFETGNALPAWAPVSVVLGHGPETVGLDDLKPEVDVFYSGDLTVEEYWKLIMDNRVDMVFCGIAEKALGSGCQKIEQYGANRLYNAGEYAVYEVVR